MPWNWIFGKLRVGSPAQAPRRDPELVEKKRAREQGSKGEGWKFVVVFLVMVVVDRTRVNSAGSCNVGNKLATGTGTGLLATVLCCLAMAMGIGKNELVIFLAGGGEFGVRDFPKLLIMIDC